MKHILTIQDISSIGRCSLTVALPVISVMGVETSVVPTAILSENSAFDEFTFLDLTQEVEKIHDLWKKKKRRFDAVYSGYLGSKRQIELVRAYFHDFTTSADLRIVDPAMGDEGKLYKGFTQAFADEMFTLCGHADVILPNLTEACFMTHTPYSESFSPDFLQDLMKKLSQTGASKVILTGIGFHDNETGAVCYDARTNEFSAYHNERIPGTYYGTGDLFASCITGALMNDYSLYDAMVLASDFTLECVRVTAADPHHKWYGVNFEKALPWLVRRMEREKKIKKE